jgi:UDP-N-acetylmuramate dehydrogenase
VTINGLVRYTIGHGLAGLADWAGTPGTVGGAVRGNAHFQGRMISESVVSVCVAAVDGTTRQIPVSEMEFGYDRSRLQRTREVALAADFRVGSGELEPVSAGALVDVAGLKGRACGAVRVSPVHANFVVNEGGARARDVASLIESMREAVAKHFGVTLEEEIVRVGEF